MTLALVLLGGAVGAPLRYLTDLAVRDRYDGVFPWGTFAVNVAGSLLLGALAAGTAHAGLPDWVMTLAGTGFCGALTTFSTWSFETIRLLEDGAWLEAMANVTLSLLAGMAAVVAGWSAVQALW